MATLFVKRAKLNIQVFRNILHKLAENNLNCFHIKFLQCISDISIDILDIFSQFGEFPFEFPKNSIDYYRHPG